MNISPVYRENLPEVPPPAAAPAAPVAVPPPSSRLQSVASWLGSTWKSVTGSTAGHIGKYFLDISIQNYHEKLLEEIDDPALQEIITHAAERAAPKLQEAIEGDAFINSLMGTTENLHQKAAEVFIMHVLTHLGRERASHELLASASETFVSSCTTFIQTPHPVLNASIITYKHSADLQAKQVIEAELTPLVDELMQKAGLDAAGFSELIYYKHQKIDDAIAGWITLLRKELLKQCFTWYVSTAQHEAFTAQERDELAQMGGKEAVLTIAQVLGQKTTTALIAEASKHSDAVFDPLKTFLSVEDRLLLAKRIEACTTPESPIPQMVAPTLQGAITTLLKNGLYHLALKGPHEAGSAISRIESYVRSLLKTLKPDPELARRIKAYQNATSNLKEAEKKLKELRAQAHATSNALQETITNEEERLEKADAMIAEWEAKKPSKKRTRVLQKFKKEKTEAQKQLVTLRREALLGRPPLTEELLRQISAQETLVEQLQNGIDHEEQKRLGFAFQPLVKKVMDDMGYVQSRDLPIPEPLQEKVYKHVTEVALPEVLIQHYTTFTDTLESLTKETRERQVHVDNLKKRFGNEDLVNTARIFAKLLLNNMESTLHLEVKEIAKQGIAKAKIALREKLPEQDAILALFSNNDAVLTEWAEHNILSGSDYVHDNWNKLIEDELEALIVHMLDNLTANIERMERESPHRTFSFVLDLVNCLTEHLHAINQVSRREGKKHMYDVDPDSFLQAFEEKGLLHPAMLDSKTHTTMENLEMKINVLTRDLQEQVDGNKQKIRDEIEEAKRQLTRLNEEVQARANAHLHKPTLQQFLTLCSINGPTDLPGPKELQNELWRLLQGPSGETLVADILLKSFAPENLNKYLRITLETANENLQAPEEPQRRRACTEEDRRMAEAAIRLLKEMRNALPGTIVGTLHRIDELQKLPAALVSDVMRQTFKDYSLNKLIEYSLIKGSKATEELLEEALPKTQEEAARMKEQKVERNKRDIKRYHKEAGEAIYNGADRVKQMVVNRWASFQAWTNRKCEFLFGKAGITAKKFFDPIMHVLFIDCVVRPVFSVFNLCMRVFYFFYSRQVVHHAEHFRRCVTETPIHANFGMTALDLFRHHFH